MMFAAARCVTRSPETWTIVLSIQLMVVLVGALLWLKIEKEAR